MANFPLPCGAAVNVLIPEEEIPRGGGIAVCAHVTFL